MGRAGPRYGQPLLDRFADECGEFARLAVVDGDGLVWLAHAQGASGGLVYQPAETTGTVPLFATASGKAWLASLATDHAIRNVLRNGGLDDVDKYGPNAIRSIEALLREIKTTANRGYGLAVNEAEPGVTAIAAAIRSKAGGVAMGTVSIAGPSVRMTEKRIRELAPRVVQCASELSALWPSRSRHAAGTPGKDVGRAAAMPV